MSVGLLDEGFRTSLPLRVRYDDGGCAPLGLERWQGLARGADAGLLSRATGPTLDVGCGPGRLVAALTLAGVPALGIDIAPAAVRLARRAGATAVRGSVFGEVPGAGQWAAVVLADGNIGIGGDPVRLLRRCSELLAPRGQVLVELQAPGQGLVLQRVRLEDHSGRTGRWFPWAVLGADAVGETAAAAGLSVEETWSAPDDQTWSVPDDQTWSAPDDEAGVRWFACLRAA